MYRKKLNLLRLEVKASSPMSERVEFIFNNSSVFNNEKRTLCLPCLFLLNFPKFIAMLISKQLTHDGLRLVCCKAHHGRHVKPLSNSSVKLDAGCDQLRRRCKNGVLFGGRRDESKNKNKKKGKRRKYVKWERFK